jgi:hypothetical protein
MREYYQKPSQHEYQNEASTPGTDNADTGICTAPMQFNTPGSRTITLSTTNDIGDTKVWQGSGCIIGRS